MNNERELFESLVDSSTRQKRSEDLLKEPDNESTPSWFLNLPRCFNDALDIRRTDRIVDGRTESVWTQGAQFSFSEGDTLHATSNSSSENFGCDGYQFYGVQVSRATPASVTETRRLSGSIRVTFYLCKSGQPPLVSSSQVSMTQDEFVSMAIWGPIEPRMVSFPSI